MNEVHGKIKSLQGLRAILIFLIFVVHTSMIGNISSANVIYKYLASGGGKEGVAFFFVLSGFVEALHHRDLKLNFSNTKNILKAKLCKIYGIHLFFLLITVPTNIGVIKNNPTKAGFKFVMNLFLMQSWFPDEQIWLGYNSVSWFLSTLMFLALFIIPLNRIANRIEKTNKQTNIYCCIIATFLLTQFLIAYGVGKNCDNLNYWLYAFPPARIADYAVGFFLGRLFTNEELLIEIGKHKATFFETISIVVLIGYMLLFPSVPEAYRQSSIYLPGALIVVFVFALNKGIVSKWFSGSIMVYLGDGAFYYMMSHQVVMRYMGMLHYYFAKINMVKVILMYIPDVFWVAVAFIITLVSRPLYEKYIPSKLANYMAIKNKG